ncbi:cellulase family glycosylhydrolase [Polyangium sp. y55x31]|uniref:cellulase family glycosylhydrolase n=1 Tax=Polyangium sp. y55x31 TaxID=3042688 RepID=UPI002482E957|nr:cellulase family glycosylhydrolase [Polyangium sp. y55x31]MDI1483283.1 cellulase family glycosylhydrolase [Polyangium sp. y55x31]
MKKHIVSMGRGKTAWSAAAVLMLVSGIGALGPGCADVEEAPLAGEETAEAASAVISPPSRVGPYRVAKLPDGTPAIVDGNGNRVVFHGVTRPGLESQWHGEGSTEPSLRIPVPHPNYPGSALWTDGIHPDEYGHMKGWGFDTVRLSVSWNYRCYGYRKPDALSSDPSAGLPCNNKDVWEIYWQIVKDNVKKIQAAGMDVIIDVRSDASHRDDGLDEGERNHMPHVWEPEDGTAQNVYIGKNLQGQDMYGNAGLGSFLRRLGHELGYKPGTQQPNDGIDRSRVVFQIFNNPYVACKNTADWFDDEDEDKDEVWRIWADGTRNPDGTYGTKPCTLEKKIGTTVTTVTKNFTYAGMRVMYERIRDFGAQNVVLVTGIDGVDLRRVSEPQFQLTGATNLAFAANPYFWFARDNSVAGIVEQGPLEDLFTTYFGYLATQAKLYPVVLTEFASGESTYENDDDVDFLHQVLLYATRPWNQFGWAAWSWFVPADQTKKPYYSPLIEDWRGPSGGAPVPSVFGRGVVEYLKATQYIGPVVTQTFDSCNPNVEGSLTWARTHALPGQWLRFDVPRDAQGNAFIQTTCSVPLKWGVRMVGNWPPVQGTCTGGRTTIDGNFSPGSGLVLEGNNDLTNITVQQFPGQEIVEGPPPNYNQRWCVTTIP